MNLPYYEDIRDYSLSDYLKTINKKGLIYKVWNRGDVYEQQGNSCVGAACATLLEAEPSPIKSPDPLTLFEEARKHEPDKTKQGVGLRAGLKALQSLNLIKSYYISDKIDEILIAVLNMGPVLVGVDLYASMRNCTGRIGIGGSIVGSHAMVVYGVDLEEQHFLIVNSWGYKWGHLGTAEISFPTMEKIFKYGFAVEK